MPRKTSNNQRGGPAGGNRQQQYTNRSIASAGNKKTQRTSDQFFCSNHGENATHNTAGCNQSSNRNDNSSTTTTNKNNSSNNNSNNNVQQGSGNKITCTQCGRNGHIAANCWGTPSQNQQQRQPNKTPPPPYAANNSRSNMELRPDHAGRYTSAAVSDATENYCPHCNLQGHNPSTCTNYLGIHEYFKSRLYCLECKTKGHMADDCNNPLSTQCTRCYRKGHSSSDCKLNPDRDAQIRLALAARSTHQRYVWRNRDIKLHPSQKAESDYEEAKRQAALSGIPISAEDDIQYQKNIFLESQIFGTNPFIEVAKNLGAPVSVNMNSQYPQPALQPRTYTSGPNIPATTTDARIAKQRALLDKMRREGHPDQDIKTFEEFFYLKNQEDKTDLDNAIANKIAASYCYRQDFVNYFLQRNEAMICTKAQLPQSRMDEVKLIMFRGGSFFRDPRAMQALFDRNIPRCKHCFRDGFIVDRWFNVIEPTTPKKSLLALCDMSDWGIFVAFTCSCSRGVNGYEYLLCSQEDYAKLLDDER